MAGGMSMPDGSTSYDGGQTTSNDSQSSDNTCVCTPPENPPQRPPRTVRRLIPVQIAFVWGTFCDWYLEFCKPLLNGSDAAAKAETQQTAGWVLDQIFLMLHPFMPFVTEELWQ